MDAEWSLETSQFLGNLRNCGVERVSNPHQLVAFCNDFLVSWSPKDGCLFAVDIKDTTDHFYRLEFSHKVVFPVERLSSNQCDRIILWGSNGVLVASLPQQLGLVKPHILQCKSWSICDLLLLSNNLLTVNSLSWFPKSTSHILVLTSDNCLRVYDVVSRLSEPVNTIPVMPSSNSRSRVSLGISYALGDVLVSFDFGSSPDEVFCLTGTGDLLFVKGITTEPNCKFKIEGPLAILPQSLDNYGSDGYSLVCLDAPPATILCIAGSEGALYHCVVLNKSTTDAHNSMEVYVFEKVVLSLTIQETDEVYRCPVILEKDVSVDNRYFCLHNSGVHVIVIPFADQLNKFAFDQNSDEFSSSYDRTVSSVEQLVCTRSSDVAPEDCTRGLCVLPHYPTPVLTVLTSEYKMISLPLTRYRMSSNSLGRPLLSEQSPPESSRLPPSTDYEEQLKLTLAGARVPLLAQSDREMTPQQCLEVALQTTQRFREKYISKLIACRKMLEQKTQLLREAKEEQREELGRMQIDLDETMRMIDGTQQRVKMMDEQKERLIMRLHSVVQCIQRKNPSMASNEVCEELKFLGEKCSRLGSVLDQTKARVEEDKDRMSIEDENQWECVLAENQKIALQERLSVNGKSVSKMVLEVKLLKDELAS